MTLQPIGVIFPDVELWACTYLREALAARSETYPAVDYVGNRVPATRLPLMVVCRRDGGNSDGLRDRARLSVRVWGETEQNTTDLARLVAALLWAAPDGAPVLKVVQQSGPTPVADESGQPLRYLVFEIHTRGEAV